MPGAMGGVRGGMGMNFQVATTIIIITIIIITIIIITIIIITITITIIIITIIMIMKRIINIIVTTP